MNQSDDPHGSDGGDGGEFTGSGTGEKTTVGNIGGKTLTRAGASMIPILQVAAGTDQGRIYRIPRSGRLTAGRGKDCQIVLLDPSCSRAHAEFFVGPDDKSYLKDLQSTNGTRINGKLVKETNEIKNDDRIQLGDSSMLKYSLLSEDEAQAQIDVYTRATRDPLTNAFNRRTFDENMTRELAFLSRGTTGLVLLLLDIDHFKKINDSFGHLAGDEILRDLTKRVQSLARAEDIFARLGGEEFAVLGRAENAEGALVFAERIRQAMEATPGSFEGRGIPFTASIGCLFVEPKPVNKLTSEQLIAKADEGLYEAKHAGRNRCVLKSILAAG